VWTRDEDTLLIEAVRLSGQDGWKGVAEQLPGRPEMACSHRWNRHICKVLMGENWSREEDAMLTTEQDERGDDWDPLVGSLPGRTAEQIKIRWIYLSRRPLDAESLEDGFDGVNLRSNVPRGIRIRGLCVGWTPSEECRLAEAVRRCGTRNWQVVAEVVPGRTKEACRPRWKGSVCPALMGENWLAEEDSVLRTRHAAEIGRASCRERV
jgi:hypothetical protein